MSDNNKKKEQGYCVKDIMRIVVGFNYNMDSLIHFIKVLNPLIKDVKSHVSIIDKIFKEKGKRINNKSFLERAKLTKEEQDMITNHSTNLENLTLSLPLLKKGSFLILISYLEILIKDILKNYYYNHWKCLLDKDIGFKVMDMEYAKNLEELKSLLVEHYVDGIIYDSLLEQVKKIYSLLNIKKEKILVDIDIINEADKRRNLFIHNEGIVNQKYIRETKSNTQIGEQLEISTDYFNKAYYEIYLFGLILLAHLISNSGDKEAMLFIICEDIYDLLENEKYDIVIRFYKSCKDVNFLSGEAETIAKVNYLLALKYSNNKQEYEKELADVKYSHMSDKYKTAFYVLKEDKKMFLKLFPKTKITIKEWNKWPLFREFRKDEKLFNKIKNKLEKRAIEAENRELKRLSKQKNDKK